VIRVHVTDTSVVTGLGASLDETWQGLMAGRSAIAPVTRFSTARLNSTLASCIDGLEPERAGSRVEPLLELLLAGFAPAPTDSRLILATTKGAIDALERFRRSPGGPPAALLAEDLLRRVAGRLGVPGPGVNINAACASSTIALARGAAMIASGRAEAVVVCCLDLVSEFVFSGFSALQGLSGEPSRPFDRDRNGLTLGEGAAALLLMSEERIRREGRRSLGTILGWGVANDANHITAPARDGCGLVQAVRQALDTAGVGRDSIAGINAHGTGTVYNDLMELTAFRSLFGDHAIPIHSVKGAIGHTLGAAGGIETALALRSLSEGMIPPTVGFRNPEEGAEGIISAAPAAIAGEAMLTTNSGFGGVNAALVIGRGGER
jgi:3-oxoacyl-[acyl-carrier-protein] synthase II